MAPLTSSQLLVLSSVSVGIVVLRYLWYKKKRIGVQSDPGEKITDRRDASVETKKESSTPLEIVSKSSDSTDHKSASAPYEKNSLELPPVDDSPSKSFSRSFSAPIPIVLPKEIRLSKNLNISDEELDQQLVILKSSVKNTDPFELISLEKNSDCVLISCLKDTEENPKQIVEPEKESVHLGIVEREFQQDSQQKNLVIVEENIFNSEFQQNNQLSKTESTHLERKTQVSPEQKSQKEIVETSDNHQSHIESTNRDFDHPQTNSQPEILETVVQNQEFQDQVVSENHSKNQAETVLTHKESVIEIAHPDIGKEILSTVEDNTPNLEEHQAKENKQADTELTDLETVTKTNSQQEILENVVETISNQIVLEEHSNNQAEKESVVEITSDTIDQSNQKVQLQYSMTSTNNHETSQGSDSSTQNIIEKMNGITIEHQPSVPSVQNPALKGNQDCNEESKKALSRAWSLEKISVSSETRRNSTNETTSSTELGSKGAVPKKNSKKKSFKTLDVSQFMSNNDKGQENFYYKDSKKNTYREQRNSSNKRQKNKGKNKAIENKEVGTKTRKDSGDSEENSANSPRSMDSMLVISSSSTSLNSSESSNDSGKGCSDELSTPLPPKITEQNTDDQKIAHFVRRRKFKPKEGEVLNFTQFLLPDYLAGKLIGRGGSYVSHIYTETDCEVVVTSHPTDDKLKIVIVTGTKEAIAEAMKLVEHRLPGEKLVPLMPEIGSPMKMIEHMKLLEGVNSEVQISHIQAPDHLFVLQPHNPTFPNFLFMCEEMKKWYSGDVPQSTAEAFVTCVAYVNGRLTRVLVLSADEQSEIADVRDMDHGGYYRLPFCALKQLRQEMVHVPFQATECYMANVAPVDGVWSKAAMEFINTISTGFVYVHITSYTSDNMPLVNVQLILDDKVIWINKELVRRGYATWCNLPSTEEYWSTVENHYEQYVAQGQIIS